MGRITGECKEGGRKEPAELRENSDVKSLAGNDEESEFQP